MGRIIYVNLCPVSGNLHKIEGQDEIPSKLKDGEFISPSRITILPEIQAKLDDGYIAVVEIDGEKSNPEKGTGRLNPLTAARTGKVAFIDRRIAYRVFPNMKNEQYAYVAVGEIEKIHNMIEERKKSLEEENTKND